MIGFNIDKTIQAAAYLVKQQPEAIENYMRLLKLLYISDRTSLQERLAPISGDTPYAMQRGPVPSGTLNLIKGADPSSEKWEQFFQRINYDIRLKSDPGNRQLSRAEINVLERVVEKFRSYDEWAMVRWCHKNIAEYEKNWVARGSKKRKRIPLEDVLDAIGKRNLQPQIVAQVNAEMGFARLFSDHVPTL